METGVFEIEFYNEVEDFLGYDNTTQKLVKTKKVRGTREEAEDYAQDQIDMGNYDDYLICRIGN